MRLRRQTRTRGVDFESFGVPIEVAVEDPNLRERVLEILPPGSEPCAPHDQATRFALRGDGDGGYTVAVGGVSLMDHGSLEVALGLLDSQIRVHVGAHANDWTFVHAGVVALDGGALVLPGESFSGKSTLVKALVEQGAVYYSDEYAVLDGNGRVHPYPRPLRIRTATATAEEDVSSLGGVVATEEAEIVLVAMTRYRPEREWQPTKIARGQGAALMLANTVAPTVRPKESLRVLTRAVSAATVFQSDRGEADPVAASLLQTLAELSGVRASARRR